MLITVSGDPSVDPFSCKNWKLIYNSTKSFQVTGPQDSSTDKAAN